MKTSKTFSPSLPLFPLWATLMEEAFPRHKGIRSGMQEG